MSIRSIKTAAALGYNVKCMENGDQNKRKESKCEDFDDILELVGSQGKFQKFLLYVVLCPVTAIEPVLALNMLFMLYEPDHWCNVPGRPENMTLDSWKNLTIPRELDGTFSKCEMITANSSRASCSFGWEYDRKDYDLTIPSQYNWVCDKSEWATWALTFGGLGNAVGTIVYGMLADHKMVGRKPIFFLCLVLNVFGRIASYFFPSNFYVFLGLLFLTGTGFPMVIGMASLPLIAWLARDWFYIGMITTVPMVLVFGFYNYIPESPRWLISVGRTEEAALIIKKMAEKNGTSDKISDTQLDSMLKLIVSKQNQNRQRVGVWTLYSRPRLALKTTLITIAWVMNGTIYYAITLNSSNLSGNQFVNFFILAMIEIPAGYFGSVLVDKGGRRWTQVAFFILCAFASIVAGVASPHKHNEGWAIASVVGAVVSKFAITLTFLVVYLQATEIFPTIIRSTGSGFASTISSIIGIFTPYIVYLSKYNLGATWFAIVAMSIVGMVSSAFLPETLGQSLPESIEDAENFGKGTKFWSLVPKTKDEKPINEA
ncbi:organic cation transporter 1 isoform X2 [Folsomia candida]|uniref:organic cation transporter 1 isoform X2 n=1 Tax=Folsomia candida TaxID=158441 RepID=UPI001604E3A8|nr:organic cation transporter 1 isoform X2 [Folsomia candida]